jgi:hypothetical protein
MSSKNILGSLAIDRIVASSTKFRKKGYLIFFSMVLTGLGFNQCGWADDDLKKFGSNQILFF